MQFLNNRVRFVCQIFFLQTRPEWMLNIMLKPCCRNLFKIADLFCHVTSSCIRTAHLHTWQSWLKTGLLPTAVNSLVTRLTSTLWSTMSGEQCLNATGLFNPSRRTSMSSRKFCSWYGTSCHKTRATKLYWAGGGHFVHTLKWTTCQFLVFVITVNVSWQWKLQVAIDYSVPKLKIWHRIFL